MELKEYLEQNIFSSSEIIKHSITLSNDIPFIAESSSSFIIHKVRRTIYHVICGAVEKIFENKL